jgi:FtsP/CotA-like multicopper oxidase with cupredoxin domain
MTYRKSIRFTHLAIAFLCLALLPPRAWGIVSVQCPGDANGDAIPDAPTPNLRCMHLGAGDGFITMADGRPLYMFGFSDLTGIPPLLAMMEGETAANFPAPTISLKQGEEFYLSLTNVGMKIRPDLFDPHTVHFHGFPEASAAFDGVPDASVSINMGSTITYYYNIVEPGTYMYHCHVEATEHMQMGMLGNLYVHPAQDDDAALRNLGLARPINRAFAGFVYNDGDGTTGFDREFPIQIGSFDPAFHDASWTVQPLPFAGMRDRYPMLNGRGYPDTINPAPLPPPVDPATDEQLNGGKVSQKVSSLIEAAVGERILLRISNLNVTNFYTLTALGLPMKVVGRGARQARGAGQAPGQNLHYDVTTVTLGGGESVDVMIDTSSVPAGRYFLYATNLNFLSNDVEDFGGMMTEIVIN